MLARLVKPFAQSGADLYDRMRIVRALLTSYARSGRCVFLMLPDPTRAADAHEIYCIFDKTAAPVARDHVERLVKSLGLKCVVQSSDRVNSLLLTGQ